MSKMGNQISHKKDQFHEAKYSLGQSLVLSLKDKFQNLSVTIMNAGQCQDKCEYFKFFLIFGLKLEFASLKKDSNKFILKLDKNVDALYSSDDE